MRSLGFLERQINIIVDCLTWAHLSFIINGHLQGSVTLTRGIRQDCLISLTYFSSVWNASRPYSAMLPKGEPSMVFPVQEEAQS